MLKWICEMASPRHENSFDDDRKYLPDQDDSMMAELIISQIEAHVVDYEVKQESRKSEDNLQKKVPDYSWLISSSSQEKPKKHLAAKERCRLDRACDRVQPSEWSQIMSTFNEKLKSATSREMIIDSFVETVHHVVISRPRPPPAVSDVINKYVRNNSTLSKVRDSSNALGSSRSLGNITFRDITDIV